MDNQELRRFAGDKVWPSLAERAGQGGWDNSLWRDLAELGITAMVIDERYGGGGEGAREFAVSLALLAGEGLDLGLVLSLADHVMLCAYPLQVFGSPGLKEDYLPSLCRGERIGAAAISEPGSGGDPSGMRTMARRQEGFYILDGVKEPVTNAPEAHNFLVLASTDAGAGKEGLTAFLVEREDGIRVEPIKLGFLPTSPHGRVILEAVRVPGHRLVGEEGWGHVRISRSVFLWERAVIIPALVAFMERWHHAVINDLDPQDISPYDRISLAQCKVELTTYRILAERLLELTFDIQEGGKERLELLLFFGRALPCWVESMRKTIAEAGLSLDETATLMEGDLKLLEVGRPVLDWQFQRLLF